MIFVAGIFFNNFANLSGIAVFKEYLSVAVSLFVNYFPVFEGLDYLTKQQNFYKSISFSKSRDLNQKKKL